MKKFCSKLLIIFTSILACIGCTFLLSQNFKSNKTDKGVSAAEEGGYVSYASTATVTPTIYWGISDDGVLTLSDTERAESTKGSFASSTEFTNASQVPYNQHAASITSIKFAGNVVPSNMTYWFYGLNLVTNIDFTNLDTSLVTSWLGTFYSMRALEEVDISQLDLSNVTTFNATFYNNSSLVKIITRDASGNSAPKGNKATNYINMLYGCSKLEEVDLSVFVSPNVTGIDRMVYNALALKSIDISNLQITSTATATNFYTPQSNSENNSGLEEFKFHKSFVRLLSATTNPTFNVPTSYSPWFNEEGNHRITSYSDLYTWATDYFNTNTSVTSLKIINPYSKYIYYTLSDGVLTISNEAISENYFNSRISPPSSAASPFAEEVVSATTSVVFTGNVMPASMYYWFYNFTNLKNINFNNLETKYTIFTPYLFTGSGLESIDISSLNFQNILSASRMFYRSNSLKTINASGVSLLTATNLYGMFSENAELEEINLTGFSAPETISINYMFSNNPKLKSVDLTGFNAPKATNMSYMFYNCTAIETIKLPDFQSTEIVSIAHAFSGLPSLQCLDLSSFSFGKVDFGKQDNYISFFGSNSTDTNFQHLRDFRASQALLDRMNSHGITLGYSSPNTYNPWYYVNDSQASLPYEQIDINLLQAQEKKSISEFVSAGAGRYINIITPWVYWGFNSETGELVISDTELSGSLSGRVRGSSFGLYPYMVDSQTLYLDKTLIKSYRVEGNVTLGRMYSAFKDCTNIVSIDLTGINSICIKSLSEIFSGCTALKEVNINSLNFKYITTFYSMFLNCSGLEELDLSQVVPSAVTTFERMFYGCTHLKSIRLDNFTTSSATTMKEMFQSCYILENLDLSAFDTSNVTDFSFMFCATFYNVDYSYTNSVLDVSCLDVSNGTNFSYMFRNCRKVTEIKLDGWNTSKGTDFTHMFSNCYYLKELDLRHFNVSNSTALTAMFNGMTYLKKLDVSTFLFSTATEISSMFGNYSNLQDLRISTSIANLFKANKFTAMGDQNPTTTNPWYYIADGSDNTALESIDITTLTELTAITQFDKAGRYVNVITPIVYWGIGENGVLTLSSTERTETVKGSFRGNASPNSYWNTDDYRLLVKSIRIDGNITLGTLQGLFAGLSVLERADLTGINSTSVKSFSSLFSNCTSLKYVNVLTLNVKNATYLNSVFSNCTSLEEIDISTWIPQNAEYINSMFNGCTGLKSVNLANFASPKATTMTYMFHNCSSLLSLDLSGFDVSKITDFTRAFYNCSSLKSINLTGFVTSSATTMKEMFYGCSSLTELDLSSFVTSKVTVYDSMLQNLTALKKIDVSNFVFASNITYKDFTTGTYVVKDLKISDSWASKMVSYVVAFNGPSYPGATNPWYYISDSDEQANTELANIDISKLLDKKITNITSFNRAGRYVNILSDYIYWAITDGEMVFSEDESLVGSGELRGRFNGGYGYPDAQTNNRWYQDQYQVVTSFRIAGNITIGSGVNLLGGLSNLVTADLTGLNLIGAESVYKMFVDCINLKQIIWGESGSTMKYITNFSYMFSGCKALENVDITSFDVSSATNMCYLFTNCNTLKSANLSGLNTASVTNMSFMFNGCFLLEDINLSGINTSAVTDMSYMFCACRALETVDVSDFDTSKVTTFSYMFRNCYALVSIDVSNFNGASATTLSYMFSYCTSLKELDLSSFVTPYVTGYEGMFYSSSKLEKLNISQIGVGARVGLNANSFTNLLNTCNALKDLTISSYLASYPAYLNFTGNAPSTSNYWYYIPADQANLPVEEVNYSQFTKLTALTSFTTAGRYICPLTAVVYWAITNGELVLSSTEIEGDITGTLAGSYNSPDASSPFKEYVDDIRSVRVNGKIIISSLYAMFRNLTNLESVDLTGMDTSNVALMAYIFSGCSSLKNVNISSLNLSFVKNLSRAFFECSSLESLDLSNLNTSSVTSMNYMFYNCISLKNINFTNFDTSHVTDMQGMFRLCTALESLDISSFNTSEVVRFDYMFDSDKNLKSLTLGENFTGLKTVATQYMFNSTGIERLDLSNFETRNILTNCQFMFNGMTELRSLNLSKINFTGITQSNNTFAGLYKVNEIFVSDSYASQIKSAPRVIFSYASANYPWFYVPEGYEDKPLSELRKVTSYDQFNQAGRYITPLDYWVCWSLTDGELVLSATELPGETKGKLFTGRANTVSPWASYADQITSIRVEGNINVNSLAYWFNALSNVTSIDLTGLNTKLTNTMQSTFNGCKSLTNLVINDLDVSNVTTFVNTFQGCSSLVELDISKWKALEVVNMEYMFNACSSLQTVHFGQFGAEKATQMYYMFLNCSSLKEVDLSGFNPVAVTNIAGFFYNCSSLESVNLSPFASATALRSINSLFYGCSSLETIDLTPLNTRLVTGLANTFYKCTNLKSVDLSNFNATSLTTIQYAFYQCVSLETLDLSSFEMSSFSNNSALCQNAFTSLNSLQEIRASQSVISKVFIYDVGLNGTISGSAPWYERDALTNAKKITSASRMVANTWYKNPYTAKIYWFVEDNTLTITSLKSLAEGKEIGDMFVGTQAFTSNATPWNDYKDSIKNIVISGSVTPASTAFWFQGFTKLKNVDLEGLITDTTTSVAYMFNGCTSLVYLNISTLNMSTITSYSYFLNNLKSCNTIVINSQQAGKMVNYSFVVQVKMYCEGLGVDITKAQEMTVAGRYLGGAKVTFTDGNGWNKVVASSYGDRIDINEIDFSSLPIPETDEVNHIMYVGLDKWVYEDGTEVDFNDLTGNITVYATYTQIKFELPEGELVYDKSEHNITVENPYEYEYTLTYYYNPTEANGIFNQVSSTSDAGYYYARLTVGTRYVDSVVYHVSPIMITVSGITAEDKTFDQSFAVTLITNNVSVEGVLEADRDTLVITASGSFANINIGENKVVRITEILTGTANYVVNMQDSQKETTASIFAKNIESDTTITGVIDKTYTGSSISQNFTVAVDGKRLNAGEDYIIRYVDNINAGEATIEITGQGNYIGNYSTTFNILKKNISTSDVSATIDPVIYTGEEITDIIIKLTFGDIELSESDFSIVSFANNISAGTASVNISGAGTNYEGNKTVTFRINQLSLEDCEIEFRGLEESYQYDGSSIVPEYTLVANGRVLEKNKDYTSYCVNNSRPGTATIRVTGKGNYVGVLTTEFTIVALNFDDCTISFEHDTLDYNGTSQKQTPIIVDSEGNTVDQANYKFTYSADTTNAGTVTVTIVGQLKYLYSTTTATYTISPISLEDATLADIASQVYNRQEQRPTLNIVKAGKTLVAGSDYEVEFTNNISVGTASVNVTGKGNYVGTISSSFEIIQAEITKVTLQVKQVYFNGNAQLPSIANVMAGSFVLNEEEYDIVYLNEDSSAYLGDFVDAAKIKVKVVPKLGNNNFAGEAEVLYSIDAAIINSISLEINQVPFNAQENLPSVIRVTTSNGYVLDAANGDYLLQYYRTNSLGNFDETTSTTDFINAGKIKVVAMPNSNNFTSSAYAIFEITPLTIHDPDVSIKYYFVNEDGEEILDEEQNRTYMVEDQFMPGKKIAPEISYKGIIVTDGNYTFNLITIEGNADNTFTSVGKYKIVVTGTGSFTGSIEKAYKINPRPFTPENIEIIQNVTEFTFNGLPLTYNFNNGDIEVYDVTDPENRIKLQLNEHFELADGVITVKYDEETLVEINPKNGYIFNTNAGTAILVLKGKDGKYSDDVIVAQFAIKERDITDCKLGDISDLTYNGMLQEPNINITISAGDTTTYTLVKGTDFTVSYENNLSVGVGTATITGINNFVGTTTINFTINPKDISDSDIVISGLDTVTYNGKEQKPTLNVAYKLEGFENIILEEDELGGLDFIVIYSSSDFVNPGEITVYIFGTNNYTGSVELTYTIDKLALTGIDLFDKVYSHQYDGLPYDLLSKIVVNYEYYELVDESLQKMIGVAEKSGYSLFYQLELADGSFGEINPLTQDVTFVNAGKIRISVQANEEGPYKVVSDVYLDFEITAMPLTEENVEDVDSVEFTGSGLNPEPIVTFNGVVLKKDSDYTLSYENNINASSEAVVIVTGMGSYKGSVRKYFVITPKDINLANVTIVNDELIYNGTTLSLSGEDVTLKINDTILEFNKDFEFAYEDGIERIVVGTYKFNIVGKGNYEGTTIDYEYNIVPRDLSTLNFGKFEPVRYTGSVLTPEFELIDNFGNTKINIGTDVVLSYGDASTNLNVAWARKNGELVVDSRAIMIVSAGTSGNYTGMAVIYFAIAPVDLATDERIEIDPITGPNVLLDEPIKIIPTIRFNNGQETVIIAENTFNYQFVNIDRAGTATVSIVAHTFSNYIGQRDVYYTILDPNDRPDLADADIQNKFADVEYDGEDKTPNFDGLKVYMGDTLLVYGQDYNIEYSTVNDYFVNVGVKEINIVAVKNGKYKGSQKISFKILGIDDDISMFLYYGNENNKLSGWTYNSYDVSQIQLSVSTTSGRQPSIDYYRVEDDGTITIIDGIENAAGTYFVRATINENGNYREIVYDHYFTISPIEITFSGVTAQNKIYDGSDEAVMNLDGLSFIGIVGDDEVSLNAKLIFDNPNVGNGKTVYITNVELIGANAKNYILAETGNQTQTTANISKRSLLVILNIPSETMVYIKVQEVDYDVEGFTQSTAGILRLSFTDQDGNVTYTMPYKVGVYDIEIVFDNETAANNYLLDTNSVLTGRITIKQAPITAENALPIDVQDYTGKEVTPNVIIIYEGYVLEKGEDFDLVYSNNTEVGTATVTVTCKGNFTGTFDLTFEIRKSDVAISDVNMQDWTYGDETIPQPTYNVPEYLDVVITYSVGSDSEGEYTSEVPTQVGSYFVKVTIDGYPDVYAICSFRILPKNLTATIDTTNYVFGQQVIAPNVLLSGVVGEDVVEYTLTYVCDAIGYNSTELPTQVGVYTVIVSISDRNYTLDASATFEISVLEAEIEINMQDFMYGDSPSTPTVTVKSNGEVIELPNLTFEFVYSSSIDGEYSSVVPTNAGTYYVKVVTENNDSYLLSQTPVSFEITKRVITITRVTADSKIYDGTTDAIVTIADVNGVLLGDDVTISASGRFSDINVSRNKVVNAYDFVLSGEDANNYIISESGNRTIATASITVREITASITAGNYIYLDPKNIELIINNAVDGDTNILGFIYKDSEGNTYRELPTNVGTYTVTLEVLNNNYLLTNEPQGTFTIQPCEIGVDMVESISDQIMTGTEITPDLVITYNGLTLKLNEDFTVTYSNNIEAGKATVHITGIGNFTGELDVNFNIIDISINVEVEGFTGEYDGEEHEAFIKNIATNPDGSIAEDAVWKYVYDGQTFTEVPKFREVGEYKVEYTVTDSNGKEISGTITVIITATQIKDVVVEGYEGTYDSQEHAAVSGEGTCTTVGDIKATWEYSLDDGEEKVYGEMPNLKNAGTYTVYFKISAANHEDYFGEFSVTISKVELTITANNKNVVVGKDMPELTYIVEGLVDGETLTDVVLNFAISCNYVTSAVTGDTFDIILSGEATNNYNLTLVNGTLTVVDNLGLITVVEGTNIYLSAPNENNVLTMIEDRLSYEGQVYLTGLREQMTWAEVLALLEDNDDITAVDIDGNPLTANSIVGTGTVITKGEDQVTVVLLGDVDGDGEVSVFDKIDLQLILEKMSSDFIIERLYAADIDLDGEVTVFDKIDMQRHLEKMASIYDIYEIVEEVNVKQNYDTKSSTNISQEVENFSQIKLINKVQEKVKANRLIKNSIVHSSVSDVQDESKEEVEIIYDFNEDKKYLHKNEIKLKEEEDDD